MLNFNKNNRPFLMAAILLLFLIGGVLIRGNQTVPKIVQVYPEGKEVGSSLNQVLFTFNHKMDRTSVEQNFTVEPNLKGKFSWIGKKMAYSFDANLEPSTSLKIKLEGAKDEWGKAMEEAYEKTLHIAHQKLYFIGADGPFKNRLIQTDLKGKNPRLISPPDLPVKDFKISENSQLIFLLTEEGGNEKSQNLYRLNQNTDTLQKIVDGTKEFVFSFNLSPNGETLLVKKAEFNPIDFGSLINPGQLWTYKVQSEKWEPFWNKELYGSELYFSPDSHFLVGRMITGDITIIPVQESKESTVYLENYAGSYALSPQGNKLAFVDFKDPFNPHQLLLRNNDGSTEVLIEGQGQIQFPIFNKEGDKIYFLMSEFENNFQETGFLTFNPYHLYEYDLPSKTLKKLTQDDEQLEGFFSLAPNGKSIALERYLTKDQTTFLESKEEAPAPTIWIYNEKEGLKNLGLKGSKPTLK